MLRPTTALVLLTAIGASGCKDLNTDLGRNVYERELEDLFADEPAGVIGTTPETHLVTFREHSFVSEPLTPADSDQAQGLHLFREAAYRIGEARANTIEGMLALKEAGASEEFLATMFPSREDWTSMYFEALGAGVHALREELQVGRANGEAAELDELRLELALVEAELEAMRTPLAPVEFLPPVLLDDSVEGHSAPADFGATSTTPKAGRLWKVQYASAARAGETVRLTATCLDVVRGQTPQVLLTACFDVTLDSAGQGFAKVDLPDAWNLVKLEGPGALPLFAAIMD